MNTKVEAALDESVESSRSRGKFESLWRRAFELGFSKGAVYILTAILQRLANFFLMALLLKYMAPEDFSRYGLFTSSLMLLAPLFSLNFHLAPGRLIFDHDENKTSERASLLVTSLSAALILATVLMMIFVGVLVAAGVRDPLTLDSVWLKGVLVPIVLFGTICDFAVTLMRSLSRPWIRLIVVLLQSYGILITLFLARNFGNLDFLAFMNCQLLTMALAGLVALFYTWPSLKRGVWDSAKMRAAFYYSSPTVVHLVAAWGIQFSGRWIGSLFVNMGELAPYMLTTQWIGIVGMFSRSIFDAQLPAIGENFAKERRSQGRKVLFDTTMLCLAVLVLIYLGLVVLFRVVGLKLPQGYHISGFMMVIALATNVFDLVYLRNSHLFGADKKTHLMAIGTIISGCVSLGLNFVLARSFGVSGLLIALLTGMVCQASVTTWLARLLPR